MPNLTQIATQQERAVLRAFTDSIQAVKDQAVISEIAALINRGDVEGVVNLLQLDPATFRPLENAVTAAYETGGATGAAQIGRIPVEAGTLVARFNVRNPRAEEWLRNLSSTRIVEIAEETRSVVRNVLTEGIARGQGPRTTALDLVGRIDPVSRKRVGGFIGLTDSQSAWVRNARMDMELVGATPEQVAARFAAANRRVPDGYDPGRSYLSRQLRDRRLDGAFKKAMAEGKPLTSKQVDTAISRMQARTLRYRAETVARTESINALRSGQHEAMVQAVEATDIEPPEVIRTWDATGDARTRPEHLNVSPVRGADTPFLVGGELLRYPGDPAGSAANTIQCRCRENTAIRWGAVARRMEGFR